jgi:hypothetical protein
MYEQNFGRLERGHRKEFSPSRLRAKSMFLFAPIRERNLVFEGLTAPFAVKPRGENCFLEDGRLVYPAIRSPFETADILRSPKFASRGQISFVSIVKRSLEP